jgi:hypothetical protein
MSTTLQPAGKENAMRIRAHFGVLAALAISLSVWAHAGSSAADPEADSGQKAQGYVFFAPGGIVGSGSSVGTLHFGGGGEALVYRGIGIGAELGYLAPWRQFPEGIGLFSVDGSYHFRRNQKLSPFVTGGYSLGFRSGYGHLVNFGAGAHYWFKDQVGLRFEFRDHVDPHYVNDHYLSGRIGLSFR